MIGRSPDDDLYSVASVARDLRCSIEVYEDDLDRNPRPAWGCAKLGDDRATISRLQIREVGWRAWAIGGTAFMLAVLREACPVREVRRTQVSLCWLGIGGREDHWLGSKQAAERTPPC